MHAGGLWACIQEHVYTHTYTYICQNEPVRNLAYLYKRFNVLLGRSRWVDYSPKYGWDYDGSQIPPEW